MTLHTFTFCPLSNTPKICAYLKQILGTLLLLGLINAALAQATIDPQSGTDPLLKPVPLAPDAASLFKFTAIPVSQSTGIPEINIPIYQISMKGVSIPIMLRYHSGGVGVTETASNVGMGWALDCGGMVTQTIKGIDDFDPRYGRFNVASPMTWPSNCDLKAAVEHKQDSEPDVFNFSFGGNSGSFYLDSLGKPIQIKEQKLKIEAIGEGSDLVIPAGGWKITDLGGIQYLFTQVATVTSKSEEFKNGSSLPDPKSAALNNKNWYLYQIIDLAGDTSTFNYDNTTLTTQNIHTSDTQFLDFVDGGSDDTCLPFASGLHQYFIQQIAVRLRLRSITFPDGNVQFTEGGNRCDLYGDTYLGKISVYNYQNVKISEHDLRYQYMIGNQWVDPANVDCSSDNAVLTSNPQITNSYAPYNVMDTRRLFLTQVDQVDQNNMINGSYKLSYENSFGLPGRFSGEQDWEGYYNHNGQNSLIQNYTVTGSTPPINTYAIQGKAPALNYAKQGILTKITYPTGGYSSFEYELNSRSASVYVPTVHPAATYTVTEGQYNVSLANFTVNNNTGSNYITFTINGCTFGAGRVTSGYSIINSQTGAVIVPQQTYSGTATNSYTFLNGSYTLLSSSSFSGCNYTITMSSWTDNGSATTVVNQNYGGLRIKDIQTFDPVTQNLLIKSYHYTTPNGFSSISMSSMWPDTNYQSRETYLLNNPGTFQGGEPNMGCGGTYTKLSSSPPYVLPTGQNGLFTYTYVTEKDSAVVGGVGTDNGYTVYQFQSGGVGEDIYTHYVVEGNPQAQSSISIDGHPVIFGGDPIPTEIVPDDSWARDKLLSKDIYKRKPDNTYTNIRSEKYFYSIHNTVLGNGYQTKYIIREPDGSNGTEVSAGATACTTGDHQPLALADIIQWTPYSIYSGYQTLDSTLLKETYDNGGVISNITYYTYNNSNLLPSITRSVDSKGGNIITNRFYPLDYNLSGTPNNNFSIGIKNLQSNYDIDPVIEQYTQRSNQDGTNLRTVEATINSYKPTILFPDTAYKAASTQPVANFSAAVITASSITKDSHYQPRVSYNQYDTHGNILEQQKINDTKEVYLWGYNHQYPVAKIVGSDYATVNSVVTQAQIDAAVAVGDASLRTLLNTLRTDTRTKNAMVSSYTYTPLIGVTSVTDAKNETMYYEYDALQRLMNVKDKDGNIIKHTDYHYQGQ